MRRFYKDVDVVADDGGFRVELDGRPIRTPARAIMCLPTRALAEAVAQEWDAQAETVSVDQMPVNRMATSAIDLMPERRPDAIEEMLGYGRTELLCYRADHPEGLRQTQERVWQPWLDWAQQTFALEMNQTSSIAPVQQSDACMAALSSAFGRMDDWEIVGAHAAVRATGSLIIGLALVLSQIGSEDAFAVSQLEALYQIEHWGLEEEQERRHQVIEAEIRDSERFLRLLRKV